MPRAEDLRGIESRTTTTGAVQYRGTVPHPEDRKRKLRGPWTSSFAEAKGWRVKAQAKAADGLLVAETRDTMPALRDAAADFVAGIKSGVILSPRTQRPYAPSTTRDYDQAFRDWINPALGDRPVDHLHAEEVQRLVDEIAAVRAPATVRNIFHALAALYSHLRPRHRRSLPYDPTDSIILPRVDNVRETIVEAELMAALLVALGDDHLAVPYALALLAGLRYAEIQSLPLDHVDLREGWIDVGFSLDPREGFKGPKSYAGARSVPIFDGLRPFLERQVAWVERRVGTTVASTEEVPGTLLLPSLKGSRFGHRELGGSFTRACFAAWGWERDEAAREWVPIEGVPQLQPLTLHEGRHSFATALVRAGYDVKDVQEWVGHSDAATTLNRYVKRRGRVGSSARVADRMNRFLLEG